MENLTHTGLEWTRDLPQLARWYAAPVGQSILRHTRLRLARELPKVFGHRALQVGALGGAGQLLDDTATLRRLVLDPRGESVGADVIADARQLPFADGSLHVVYLPHTLDYCDAPHQVLREANRVLTDDGFLVLMGFNLWSSWGARRAVLHWRKGVPWRGHFFSAGRVADWLSVLDFNVMERVGVGPAAVYGALPSGGKLRLGARALREYGAPVYVLLARKQSIPLNPAQVLRARQRGRQAVVSGAFAHHSSKRDAPGQDPTA